MLNCCKMFIEKYKSSSAPFKAGLWFAMCNILQKGISMITVPIFTRILTTEQYGIYSVYQSWYQIIIIFATLNLYFAVFNNGMVKFENDRDRYISSLQGLSSTLTVSLFIIYILWHKFWNNILGLSTLFVVAMFVELLFEPAYSFWAARQRFEYKYRSLIIVTIMIAISSPLLGIIAVLNTEYKAEARVLTYVLVQVCFGLGFYIYNIRQGKALFVKKYWKYALLFNIPLIPHYLSQSVLQQSDRIMISKIAGTDKAAIYSVAYNISSLMTIIINAINNAYIPFTYNSIKEKKYDGLRRSTNGLIVLVAALTVVVMFFGPEVIRIFAPEEYYEAVMIIPPVSASVFFMFLYPVFGNFEFYFEENKFVVYASLVGAIANIILNFICIPVFGYVAAGYTTLFCYILFSGGHFIFAKRVMKKHSVNAKVFDMKFIIIISIVEMNVVLFMSVVYGHTIIRYVCLLVFGIVGILKKNSIISLIGLLRKK